MCVYVFMCVRVCVYVRMCAYEPCGSTVHASESKIFDPVGVPETFGYRGRTA